MVPSGPVPGPSGLLLELHGHLVPGSVPRPPLGALPGGRVGLDEPRADSLSPIPPQACIDENLEVVRFLVEQGATVNQADNEGWTPLHVAASCGYLDIAR